MMKLSVKKLKELQERLGGIDSGFYITAFGSCIESDKHIYAISFIAYAQKSNANWSYRLVKGIER